MEKLIFIPIDNAKSIGMDLDTYLKLSGKLVAQFPNYIKMIKIAIEENNHEQIIHLSHKLKGVCANYRFKKLAEIAALLEEAGKVSEKKSYQELSISLESECNYIKSLF